jgi:hypothetical protein
MVSNIGRVLKNIFLSIKRTADFIFLIIGSLVAVVLLFGGTNPVIAGCLIIGIAIVMAAKILRR